MNPQPMPALRFPPVPATRQGGGCEFSAVEQERVPIYIWRSAFLRKVEKKFGFSKKAAISLI
jgi:hypothetical protein